MVVFVSVDWPPPGGDIYTQLGERQQQQNKAKGDPRIKNINKEKERETFTQESFTGQLQSEVVMLLEWLCCRW